MFSRSQITLFYVAASLTVAFAGITTWMELVPRPASSAGRQPLAPLKTLSAFSFTNQDGRQVSLDDLKGKVWLADFVYTTCPGPCPLITAHMARLQGKLPVDARIVSFSTDPESDTPPVLKAYAAKFGASSRWSFLTGPKDQVYDLIQHGFLLPIASPAGAQIIHSTRIMLVDKTGTVREFYDGTTNDADNQIIGDVQKLESE